MTVKKANSQDEISWHSDSSGIFSSSESNLQRQSLTHLSWTSNHRNPMDREAGSKTQRTISELTSLLTLVFHSDALWRSGSERHFLTPNSSANLRSTRLRKLNDFRGKEKYLGSLQVLTNCLVIMSNVLLISDNVEDRSGSESVEGRYVSHVRYTIMYRCHRHRHRHRHRHHYYHTQ